MREVSASLHIEVLVNCPECDYLIDLTNESDTNGHCHNEEGHVTNQACPDGSWHEKHKNFEVSGVACGECKHSFDVKGLEW